RHLLGAQSLGLSLDCTVRRLLAGRVDELEGDAIEFQSAHEIIARGSRLRAHQCFGILNEGVEQTALTGIGAAGQHDVESLVDHGPLLKLLAKQRKLSQSLGQAVQEVDLRHEVKVLLGKVQPRLNIGKQIEQIFAQTV